jgi:DnaJ family protein C protein 28
MQNHPRSLDEQIKKAIEDGAFNDLPGRGKPMDLSENPFEDPSWRMANRMLRSSGFSLPWIETRKEIEMDYKEAYKKIKRTWQWRVASLDSKKPRAEVDREWVRALEQFNHAIDELNQRIFDYNLEAPLDQLKIRLIDPENEVSRITSHPD